MCRCKIKCYSTDYTWRDFHCQRHCLHHLSTLMTFPKEMALYYMVWNSSYVFSKEFLKMSELINTGYRFAWRCKIRLPCVDEFGVPKLMEDMLSIIIPWFNKSLTLSEEDPLLFTMTGIGACLLFLLADSITSFSKSSASSEDICKVPVFLTK